MSLFNLPKLVFVNKSTIRTVGPTNLNPQFNALYELAKAWDANGGPSAPKGTSGVTTLTPLATTTFFTFPSEDAVFDVQARIPGLTTTYMIVGFVAVYADTSSAELVITYQGVDIHLSLSGLTLGVVYNSQYIYDLHWLISRRY